MGPAPAWLPSHGRSCGGGAPKVKPAPSPQLAHLPWRWPGLQGISARRPSALSNWQRSDRRRWASGKGRWLQAALLRPQGGVGGGIRWLLDLALLTSWR